jgi:APA family basic amino acid/polyamine antiporter
VIVAMTVILVLGIKLSSQFNQIVTAIKILVTLFIIGFGVWFIDAANLSPLSRRRRRIRRLRQRPDAYLLPSILGIDTIYGVTGIFTGAALVFFAYIGFDIVATTSEEARNPQRDIPIGIFASLGSARSSTSWRPWSLPAQALQAVATAAPAATALEATPFPAAQFVVSAAILIGLTVVVMILILGQSRVAFAMSRDNLLPRWLAGVHPTFRTPYRITIITGVVASILAFFLPLTTLGELVNIGTLAAFVLVSLGVLVLRRTQPDLPRAFRTPLVPLDPHRGGRPLPLRDGLPYHRDLDPVPRLDGPRHRLLLPLQPLPQPPGPHPGRRRDRREVLTRGPRTGSRAGQRFALE